MKHFSTVLFVLILSICNIYAAKNTSTIKGVVIDKNTNEAVSFATVSIHRADSTIVTGATTNDDGSFIIPNLPFAEYTLRVSFIGYKDSTFPLIVDKANIDLGTIALEEDAQMLASAVVTDKRALVEQKIDKLIMNVSELATTQGSNGVDILRKAPGISIDKDGNVKLNGQSVEVWIDNRPSYLDGKQLEALLLSTPGTTIDKIEIMAHPSAKYDAQGSGGIINIKTKRNFAEGFNGTITGTYGGIMADGRYLQEAMGSVNLGHRGKMSNTTFLYAPTKNQNLATFDSWTLFGEGLNTKQTTSSDLLFDSMNHGIRLASDIFANKKNTFGFIVSSNLMNELDKSTKAPVTETFIDDIIISRQESDITMNDRYNDIKGNLNYTHYFNEQKGSELTINADYAYYDFRNLNKQSNIFVLSPTKALDFEPEIFETDGKRKINMYSVKADYQQSFWQTGMIEAGAKWSMNTTDNKSIRVDWIDEEWRKNQGQSSDYLYNEQVSAAYISATKVFGAKWVAKAGLRGEYTRAVGDWISAGEKAVDSYFDLFPTLYLGFNPNNNNRISFSYSRRIGRPLFGQLNPQRMYIDSKNAIEGNPHIKPQYANNFYLSYGYNTFLNVAFIYSSTNSLITQIPFISEKGESIQSWGNFGSQYMAGMNISITELQIFKWMILNFSAYGAKIGNDSGDGYKKSSFLKQANMTLSFILPKDWRIDMDGFAQSGMPFGYYFVHPMYQFAVGVKKSLLQNRASLSLKAEDVLRTARTFIEVETNGVKNYSLDQKFYNGKVSLTFTYNFGNMKPIKKRNVGNLEDASRVGGGNTIGK